MIKTTQYIHQLDNVVSVLEELLRDIVFFFNRLSDPSRM